MKPVNFRIRHGVALPMALMIILSVACATSTKPNSRTSAAEKMTENTKEVIDILEKHVAAMGGLEALKAVKTVDIVRESEIFGTTHTSHVIRERQGRRFVSHSEGSHGVVEAGFDGTRVWQNSPFHHGYLADTDPHAKMMSQKPPELWEYRKSGRKYDLLPKDKVDGTECIVLESASSDLDPLGRESPVKYFLDNNTYRLKQIIRGNEVTQSDKFDDYRQIDGVWEPFAQTTKTPSAEITSKVVSLRHNVAVTPSLFELPGGDKEQPAPVSNTSKSPATETVLAATDSNGNIPESKRIESFELVWSTINETYWDPTFGGKDWKGIHDKYLPLVRPTASSDAYHELLNQMLAELDRSHLKIRLPSNSAGLHTTASELKNGSVGLDVRWIDNQMVVIDAKKEYPAERAGIKKGFIILKVNDKSVEDIYDAYKKKNKGFALHEPLERVRAIREDLKGNPGVTLTLEVLDVGNQKARMELTRKASPVDHVVEFESRRVDGNIGYIRFDLFFGDVLAKFRESLEQMRDTKGLIIDLRGNPGGAGDLTQAIANNLITTEGSLGSSKSRYGERQLSFSGSGQDAYNQPIVILVDELSGSSSEVFTGGLQAIGRVKVVGTTTAGAVLPSLIKLLPTGGSLQYVVADYKTPKGTLLEGRGVVPDIEVRQTRAALSENRDLPLEKAVATLRNVRS